MTTYRANFKIESIGIYPHGKAIYLTVAPEIAQERSTKLSILLDRTEDNLEVIGNVVQNQIILVKLYLDTSSRDTTTARNGSEIIRYRASKIEIPCEPSMLKY